MLRSRDVKAVQGQAGATDLLAIGRFHVSSNLINLIHSDQRVHGVGAAPGSVRDPLTCRFLAAILNTGECETDQTVDRQHLGQTGAAGRAAGRN